MTPTLKILEGDCRSTLATLPEESVQCCVTSPPYWGLRDYNAAGQIGLEDSFAEWLEAMLAVFDQVWRVLRDDGVCWVNMGDCYANSGSGKQGKSGRLKPKDLVGQPWRLAFALQESGWYLRRDIVWHKPNPMPETVYDRPSTAHEYVFLLTKSARYFYNADEAREPVTGNAHARGDGLNKKIAVPDGWATGKRKRTAIEHSKRPRQNPSFSKAVSELVNDRNWRSVWNIPTEAYGGGHFATFPQELARRCIIAGSRKGDVVLDPFGGSGTTGAVALEQGRSAVLCELNKDYIKLLRARCERSRPHWSPPIPQVDDHESLPLFAPTGTGGNS